MAVTRWKIVETSSVTDESLEAIVNEWTGQGWAFEAWSGTDPRLLANVQFLAGYRRPALIDAGLIPAVLDAAAGQVSAEAIEQALSPRYPPVLVRPVVLHLLWTGRLRADLTRPLSADTPVRLREAVSV